MNLSQDIYNLLVTIHSIGRWALLLLLIFVIFNHLLAGRRPFIRSDANAGLILTVIADIMLLVGLVLYFAGNWGYKLIEENGMSAVMKNATMRFFAVEHMVGMIIAIALIHIGKVQGKKSISDKAKHRRSLIFYALALLIILITIPWPFREIGQGRGWY
jgi:hypothetical protein